MPPGSRLWNVRWLRGAEPPLVGIWLRWPGTSPLATPEAFEIQFVLYVPVERPESPERRLAEPGLHEHQPVPHIRCDSTASLLRTHRTTAVGVDTWPTFGICQSVCLSVSVSLSGCLSDCLVVCLSVCLSVMRVAGFHPSLFQEIPCARGQVLPAFVIQLLCVE